MNCKAMMRVRRVVMAWVWAAGMAFAAVGVGQAGAVPEGPVRGVVVETMNSGGYTYVLLKGAAGKQWYAAPEALVKAGDEVELQPEMEMDHYTSPTLKRTFERLVFATGINVQKRVLTSAGDDPGADKEDKVKIAKAKGPDACTIAEIYARKDALNGKPVSVRGQVVKSSPFNGQHWLRIIDGSGNSQRGDHKLIVISSQDAAPGEMVLAHGKVSTGKSFGALSYEVVVEDAKLEKQGK
ncbi:MAG: hypothetical protein M0T76_08955 [Desulfobacteraceae bacterium]|nr:hypothetical protein [Desulfobacteraceae bacterium]